MRRHHQVCANSAHDVHHASVCVNVVIGVLVVLCELHVIVRVHVISLCDDAVVGLTLGLIAHVVVALNFLYLEVYSLQSPLSQKEKIIFHQKTKKIGKINKSTKSPNQKKKGKIKKIKKVENNETVKQSVTLF